MRRTMIIGTAILYLLMMTFCAYTPVVSQYINNDDNYIELDVKVSSTIYNEEGYSYLYINLLEFERYAGFTGVIPEILEDELLDTTVIEIKIVPGSASILKERGFFDIVKAGDIISVRTTCWIYDDIARHYLGSVTAGDITYLSFEEGLDAVSVDTRKLNELEIGEIFNKSQEE